MYKITFWHKNVLSSWINPSPFPKNLLLFLRISISPNFYYQLFIYYFKGNICKRMCTNLNMLRVYILKKKNLLNYYSVFTGLEVRHTLWFIWNIDHYTSCYILQYKTESRLAYGKDAQSGFYCICSCEYNLLNLAL